jgi:hypothetical protein
VIWCIMWLGKDLGRKKGGGGVTQRNYSDRIDMYVMHKYIYAYIHIHTHVCENVHT